MAIRSLRQQTGSDRVVSHSRDRIFLHQWHVLHRRRVIDDLRMVSLKNLVESFPIRQTQPCPQLVFVWLYRLSDEFVLCLQQRKPIALVILAHIVVLLNDLSSFWWIGGWIDHIMSEVYAALTEEYRTWMRWPIEEIGWLPG